MVNSYSITEAYKKFDRIIFFLFHSLRIFNFPIVRQKLILSWKMNYKMSTRFFSSEQFYNNNEAQICTKIKNKLRTIEAPLPIQM